jgi:hypothetical protein
MPGPEVTPADRTRMQTVPTRLPKWCGFSSMTCSGPPPAKFLGRRWPLALRVLAGIVTPSTSSTGLGDLRAERNSGERRRRPQTENGRSVPILLQKSSPRAVGAAAGRGCAPCFAARSGRSGGCDALIPTPATQLECYPTLTQRTRQPRAALWRRAWQAGAGSGQWLRA